MALTAVTVYAPERDIMSVVAVALVFGAVNLPSVGSWVWLGRGMARFLTSPGRARAFNVVMALLLLGSMYPMLT